MAFFIYSEYLMQQIDQRADTTKDKYHGDIENMELEIPL